MSPASLSIQRVLTSWMAVGMALVVMVLSYFIYQSQMAQFHLAWATRIENDLGALRIPLQEQMSEGDWVLADQTLTRMGVQPHVANLCLVVDGTVRSSTRHADVGEPFVPPAVDLRPDLRGFGFRRDGTLLYASLPAAYRGADLRENAKASLHAEYDIGDDLAALYRTMAQRILAVAAILALFVMGIGRMLRDKLVVPLRALAGFATRLSNGDYGAQVQLQAADEFMQLERAFNELSNSLRTSVDRLQKQAMRDQAFAEAFPDTAFLVDHEGNTRSRYGNPSTTMPGPELGAPFDHWLAAEAAGELRAVFTQVLANKTVAITEFRHGAFHLESRMAPLARKDGASEGPADGVLWLIRDTSEIKRHQAIIEHQAKFDALTDLANRRFALLHIAERIAEARREGRFGSVIFIDLDRFANINDSLGHPVGDQLLVALGKRFEGQVRCGDLIARLGGDEFLLILDHGHASPEIAANHACECAEALRAIIKQPFEIGDNRFVLSASMGVAVYPSEGCDANDVVRQADTAMYHAKNSGRDTASVYTESMLEENQRKLRLYSDLRGAIARGEFHLVFQPQVDAEGQLVGAEVLARWAHQGNPISPERFIRAAEETNQIVALGQWILGASLDALRRWREQGRLPPSFRRIAINISVRQFMEPRFEAMLAESIAAAGVPNDAIELELTESVFVESKEQVREKMQRLNESGFSFAMDDFGTGYSSLSYLQHLPIDKLKIDRSFVMDIQRDDGSARIVDSIIQLGRSLGVAVIAEGVETDVQRRYLEARGCLLYQGYFFSRPLGEEAFLSFAEATRAASAETGPLSRPKSAGTPLPP